MSDDIWESTDVLKGFSKTTTTIYAWYYAFFGGDGYYVGQEFDSGQDFVGGFKTPDEAKEAVVSCRYDYSPQWHAYASVVVADGADLKTVCYGERICTDELREDGWVMEWVWKSA